MVGLGQRRRRGYRRGTSTTLEADHGVTSGCRPDGPRGPAGDGAADSPSRVAAPASLAELASDDLEDRAAHSHGKAFRDVVRNLHGDLTQAPDLVLRPRTEGDVVDVLDWCSRARIAVIPFGGGSSVVGGIEPRFDGYDGVVSLDLGALNAVVEIDRTSRAAHIQAGVLGPDLEDQLRPHSLTLRHYPQSFESRHSAAGWPPARADTTQPCTPTSTTFVNRCAS